MGISLNGKCAIVTGAANGVGLSIAKIFVSAGANVVLSDMDEDNLTQETNILAEKNEGKVLAFCGDLREKLTIKNLLASTIDNFGSVDILINASRQVLTSDPLNPKDDTFDQLIHQNVTVNFRLSQAVARRMISQVEDKETGQIIGSIVNLTSIASNRTQPEILSYSVSSAGLDQLTRSMAVALAPKGIRVNAVSLGSVMSASLRNMMRENLDLNDQVIDATPLGKIGDATEAAKAVLFLASDLSSFVTGQILAVDGGRSLIDRMNSTAY
ncbi:MAG: SDR family NAD(P)-dependent oxidoreductase [Paracoccaceae bacterium]|nr:SDR family NAD(P)-dependent oxidoreductase [Paracoccaceae bacterium]